MLEFPSHLKCVHYPVKLANADYDNFNSTFAAYESSEYILLDEGVCCSPGLRRNDCKVWQTTK